MNPLIRLIPPPLVRFFAKPYVAGDSLAKAVEVAAKLYAEEGYLSSLDLLAEGIETAAQVEKNVDTYLRMIDAVAADPRFATPASRPSVSLKPSSYTTAPMEEGGDAAGSLAAMQRIVERAAERGVAVTVDMESRHWTDFTLDCLRTFHDAGHEHVGAVLQTRLHRTREDLDRLPAAIRVRLVIGIYCEPEDLALSDKGAMKERMLEYARLLLERGHYVEFATHDEAYIQRFLSEVVEPMGVGPERFELQLLYGVPRARLCGDLMQRGLRVRLYVPFAEGWAMAIAYLRRRLDECPAMAWLVLKNWFRRG